MVPSTSSMIFGRDENVQAWLISISIDWLIKDGVINLEFLTSSPPNALLSPYFLSDSVISDTRALVHKQLPCATQPYIVASLLHQYLAFSQILDTVSLLALSESPPAILCVKRYHYRAPFSDRVYPT